MRERCERYGARDEGGGVLWWSEVGRVRKQR